MAHRNNMHRLNTKSQQQASQGFVLPVFIVLLIIVGAGSANSLSRADLKNNTQRVDRTHRADEPFYLNAVDQIRQLHRAKQALIAYAVTYTDNYGPTGAGPGHLPCPDRDPPDDGNSNNDGPDPPCSNSSSQVGRLPRLTLAENRTVNDDGLSDDNRFKLLEFFPQQSFLDRQPWYWLDDGFINNPLNRQVNTSTVTARQNSHGRDVVAVLLAPGAEFGNTQQRPGLNMDDYVEILATTLRDGRAFSRDYDYMSNDLQVFIYRDEIMRPVVQRVAEFITRQATSRLSDLVQAFAAGTACEMPMEGQPDLRLATCFDWLLDDNVLESFPSHRHWYFRNGWHELTGVAVGRDCLALASDECPIVPVVPITLDDTTDFVDLVSVNNRSIHD